MDYTIHTISTGTVVRRSPSFDTIRPMADDLDDGSYAIHNGVGIISCFSITNRVITQIDRTRFNFGKTLRRINAAL